MKQKIRLTLLAIAMMAIHGQTATGGGTAGSTGLIFTISLPKTEFSDSDPIPLMFVVQNGGTIQQRFPSVCGGEDKSGFPFLRSGAYLICQRRRDVLRFKGGYAKAHERRALEPGESHKAFDLDLNKCFDLGPGTYEVQLLFSAARNSPFPDGASNRLTFTINKE
jgi:hypothetical protein